MFTNFTSSIVGGQVLDAINVLIFVWILIQFIPNFRNVIERETKQKREKEKFYSL